MDSELFLYIAATGDYLIVAVYLAENAFVFLGKVVYIVQIGDVVFSTLLEFLSNRFKDISIRWIFAAPILVLQTLKHLQ